MLLSDVSFLLWTLSDSSEKRELLGITLSWELWMFFAYLGISEYLRNEDLLIRDRNLAQWSRIGSVNQRPWFRFYCNYKTDRPTFRPEYWLS